MKWLSILILLVCGAAHALPICHADDPSGNGDWSLEMYFEAGSVLPDGACVVWYCDVDHQWKADGFCFTPTDAEQYSMTVARSWIGLSKDDRNQLWANNVKPVTPGTLLYRMIQWRDTLPKPTTAPPSGWVTTTTTAYKRTEQKGTYLVKATGTVNLKVACHPTNVVVDASGKSYHALIDVTSVAMTKINGWTPPKPTTLYGECE